MLKLYIFNLLNAIGTVLNAKGHKGLNYRSKETSAIWRIIRVEVILESKRTA